MNKYKILLCLFSILVVGSSSYPTFARCSKRRINRVCNQCRAQGANTCPKVEVCQSCSGAGDFVHLLKDRYRLTTSVFSGQTESFQINFLNNNGSRFNDLLCDTTNFTGFLSVLDNVCRINYDVISFTLPVFNGASVETINCIGQLNEDSTIDGRCRKMGFQSGTGQLGLFGGEFSAIPN